MGFRDYSPGLNRFLTRDAYSGALADLNLGTDPWTSNRYAFAGGNPISGVEIDGHYAIDDEGNRVPPPQSGPAKPPTVENPELQKIVNDTYARPGVGKVIGDGKAGTALTHELRTGIMTEGRNGLGYHHTDVADLARRYSLILEADRKSHANSKDGLLSPDDVEVARAEFTELWGDLEEEDVTNKVSENLRSRGLADSTSNTMQKIRSTAAVADVTGEPFDQVPYKQPRIARAPSGRIFGRALGVAGFVFDIPVGIAAYRSYKAGNMDELAQAVYGDEWRDFCYGCSAPVS
jgi:hypothetical protein